MKNAKRNAKRIVLGSLVASLLLTQVNAAEVYKDEEKKTSVDVYGSIRGYAGEGTSFGNGAPNSNVTSKFIFGMQSSSRLGVTGKIGKVTAQFELGANLEIRQLWGSYNFGDAGKILIGRTDSISVAKGFSSDIFDNDNGATGFGSIRTSNRKTQIQYSVKGFQVALVDDTSGDNIAGDYTGRYGFFPRIAAAYGGKGDSSEYKVAATIKILQGGQGDARFNGGWGFGGHIFGGYKMHLMDKKAFVSAQVHFGLNGNTYGEQRVNRNTGGFGFSNNQISYATMIAASTSTQAGAHHLLIGGALVEVGFKVGSLGTLIGAVGYQYAGLTGANTVVNGFSGMVQLPMKFGKFTLTPQISYYGTVSSRSGAAGANLNGNGLMAFVQGRFDF